MKTKLLIILGLAVATGIAATSYWNLTKDPSHAEHSSLLVEASPEKILTDIKALNSPLVLVNFWASWCGPCKAEFPFIMSLRKKFADRGLKVVFVSVDEEADADAALAFLKEQNVDFPTYFKGKQSVNFVAKIFPNWSGAIPATIMFAPDQKVVESWEGDATLQEFESKIQKHL
jgi:thiol-disulfide isomerase/thioredoxin